MRTAPWLFFLSIVSLVAQDNDRVRVLKVTSAPGEKSSLHQHAINRVMIYLDAGHQTLSHPGGRVDHLRFKAGETRWSPAGGEHVSENVGERPVRIVEIELKQGPGRPVQMPPLDPVKVDPKHYKVEFENDQVRVVRARYGPHEKGALHEHALERVVVFLTDSSVKATTPDGASSITQAKAGDVRLLGMAKHQEENLGDGPFEVLVVEMKPASGPKLSNVFGGAQIEEIYRIRLDRDDLLLESILDFIAKNNIQDGAVLTAAGSLQECTFHGVATLDPKPVQKFTTVKGEAMEILNINGMIAAGEPHLHMTISNFKGAFGGHLEKGCRVLYRAELTIAKFSGAPLARKPNEQGVPVLQGK